MYALSGFEPLSAYTKAKRSVAAPFPFPLIISNKTFPFSLSRGEGWGEAL